MILVLLLKVVLAQQIDYGRCEIPADAEFQYYGHYEELDSKDELTFTELKKIITDKKVKTIDDLVPELKNHRKGWTAMYRSSSAQEEGASCKSPRIISFGRNGKLILGWVNCKNKESDAVYPDCEKLETIETNHHKSTLVEISLPGKNSSSEAKFSEPNPSRCIHCHGSPPMPIFESYNIWPGAFGSVSRNGNDVIKKDSNEDKCYNEFLKNSKPSDSAGRFNKLYFDDDRKANSSEVRNLAYPVKHSIFSDPNDQLTKRVVDQSSSIIVSEILKSHRFAQFRYAFVAHSLRTILNECLKDKVSDFEEYFPVSYRIGETAYQNELERVIRRTRSDFKRISNDILENNSVPLKALQPLDPLAYYDAGSLGTPNWKVNAIQFTSSADFEYLLKQIDFPMRRLGPSIEQKYNQKSGTSELQNLIAGKFLKTLASCDPEIKKILEMSPEKKCDILIEKSKNTIQEYDKAKKAGAVVNKNAVN